MTLIGHRGLRREPGGRSAVKTGSCAFGNGCLAATGHTRASGAVAGDGLPGLDGSAPGLLSKRVRSARRVADQCRCLGCVARLDVLGDEASAPGSEGV